MPSGPRSRGCQTCKDRKLKCDENWPTCTRCAVISSPCPGPTSLVKFVTKKPRGARASSGGGQPLTGEPRQITLKKSHRPIWFHSIYQSDYQKPRPNPTTRYDHIALRLVSSLERGPQGITTLSMSYLPELPARLSESKCLRDSVDLFCSALIDFRNHKPEGELHVMTQYGKALRSLRMTLLGNEAFKPETMAAMALLERMERLFRRGTPSNVHTKGILQAVKMKGPPKLKDHLDVAVANELYGILLNDWSLRESCSFFSAPDWQEAIDLGIEQFTSEVDMGPFSKHDTFEFVECSKQLHTFMSEFNQISNQSHTAETKLAIESFCHRVSEVDVALARIVTASKDSTLKQGTMVEKPDPESPMGTKYEFRTPNHGMVYLGAVAAQIGLLRILYESAVIVGSSDAETTGQRLRERCHECWKCLPYVLSLESIVAENFMGPIYVSYETANEEEEEYLLDAVEYIDRYVKRFPPNRSEIRQIIVETAKLMTGRASQPDAG
ncbi:unnamed protein product [Clonostachys byssicola]|uniref:Zn(2)-C6 fungal-type domain-containing protein n=1 Tax=Clonostachys byssicola TaxID=160290 RepID=A0A9N9UUZ1_9HYPO|nr:unnamed protein product [Clonostachys byssicola]